MTSSQTIRNEFWHSPRGCHHPPDVHLLNRDQSFGFASSCNAVYAFSESYIPTGPNGLLSKTYQLETPTSSTYLPQLVYASSGGWIVGSRSIPETEFVQSNSENQTSLNHPVALDAEKSEPTDPLGDIFKFSVASSFL